MDCLFKVMIECFLVETNNVGPFQRDKKFQGMVLGLSVYEGVVGERRIRREIIEHPGAAAILAMDSKKNIIMVNQYRFPHGNVLEVPAGTLENGEDPLECAHRELQEETGYTAKSIKPLLSFYPSIGYNTEIIHCFVATGLTLTKTNLDEDEILSVEVYPLNNVISMIQSGKIKDSKTICSILAYNSAISAPDKK